MLQRSVELYSTWFYVGKVGFAPGTVATLATVPLAYGLMQISPFVHMGVVVLMTLVAFTMVDLYERWSGQHDPKEVVIDEVVGYLIAMVWLPLTWQSFVAAFVIFRALDILKPYPLSWIDQNVRGSVGVMADDVVAGLVTNLVLQIVGFQTLWLGVQLQ